MRYIYRWSANPPSGWTFTGLDNGVWDGRYSGSVCSTKYDNTWFAWCGGRCSGSIKTQLNNCGIARLSFGNCQISNHVLAKLNGKEIARAAPDSNKKIEFNFNDGDTIELIEIGNAAIVFEELSIISCSACNTIQNNPTVIVRILDNDGIPDDIVDNADEQVLDFDNDGILDQIDNDEDNDGIPDNIDMDDDNDGIPDDIDYDNDGISDNIENDYDGISHNIDNDCDNDGIPDNIDNSVACILHETYNNIENESGGISANIDNDCDNDGIPDNIDNSVACLLHETIENIENDYDRIPHDVIDPNCDNNDLLICLHKTINNIDNDYDNDVISDNIDNDYDGIHDNIDSHYDNDCDNDGIPDDIDNRVACIRHEIIDKK